MPKLISSAIASLDLYVADRNGTWDWAVPDEEVHAAVNDVVRPVGTFLLGRRMYEVLSAWESPDIVAGGGPAIHDFAAIWHGADKVVYSRTLDAPASARTRIERDFDPEAVRRLKASADRDLSIGGPELAGQALAAGLVDEVHLFLFPVIIGGGTRALPDDVRLDLELLHERRFANGAVHLRYGAP